MADKLLAARGKGRVGQCWAKRFVNRSDELKISFTRAKDRQRERQEDPAIITDWFRLVSNTKAKYGVIDDDTYNFDKIGF